MIWNAAEVVGSDRLAPSVSEGAVESDRTVESDAADEPVPAALPLSVLSAPFVLPANSRDNHCSAAARSSNLFSTSCRNSATAAESSSLLAGASPSQNGIPG